MRDNYTCCDCGKKSCKGEKVYLNAHHKIPFSEDINLRFDVDNGVTLCIDCHKLIEKEKMKGNNRGKRIYK